MVAQTDVAVFLFVLLVGVAAFFFGVIYFLFNLLFAAARGLGRMLGLGRVHCGRPVSVRVHHGGARCTEARCGSYEPRPGARYCSRCGARLSGRGPSTDDPHAS